MWRTFMVRHRGERRPSHRVPSTDAGTEHERNREMELAADTVDGAAPLGHLTDARELPTPAMPLIGDERLAASVSLPTLAADDRRSGWLGCWGTAGMLGSM